MQISDSNSHNEDVIDGEPLLIGLTGGIGSGKTTVATIFEKAGFPIINADFEARTVMEEDKTVKDRLITRFGPMIYSPDGSLNASELSEIVFQSNDSKALVDLNAIVHPVVLDRIFTKAEILAQDHDVVMIDIALLFENNLEDGFDYVIGVMSKPEFRKERLERDRGMSAQEVDARIKTQIGDEILKEHCDFLIENNGSKEDLVQATQYLVEILPYLPNTDAE